MDFLDTFAMIALWIGQAKQAFLQKVTSAVVSTLSTQCVRRDSEGTYSCPFQKAKATFW